jgi:hypothetical protein
MDENLIGYLLNALDGQTQRETEAYLMSDADARARLETLRRALNPLEVDRDQIEPPPGLRLRTLALIAEQRVASPDRVLKAPMVRQTPLPRSRWVRADLLVAASILLLALPLIPPALNYAKSQQAIVSCRNNLRGFYQALMSYSDHHEKQLPLVEENPPHDYAGFVVPALFDGGWLGPNGTAVSVNCPGNGMSNPPMPLSVADLDAERFTRPDDFERDVAHLFGCYAYSLGYRENGRHLGLRRDLGNDLLPVMADRPPFEQTPEGRTANGNSRNHGGAGQNVLRLGGDVQFFTTRSVGVDSDIYLNRKGRSEAGLDMLDSVLGASSFRPYPNGMPEN